VCRTGRKIQDAGAEDLIFKCPYTLSTALAICNKRVIGKAFCVQSCYPKTEKDTIKELDVHTHSDYMLY